MSEPRSDAPSKHFREANRRISAAYAAERQKVYTAIQMVTGGYPSMAVLLALCDSLAMTIGYMASDMRQADAVIDDLPADLKKAMRDNWPYLRDLRAKGGFVSDDRTVTNNG